MNIKNFVSFIAENYINPVKSDLKKFDGKVRHKQITSRTGETFNVWIAKDEEASKRLTRLYVGKHALDLGGYAPSTNDIWMSKDEYVCIIKTNKDDIVPRDVLLEAANILRRMAGTHKEEQDTVEISNSMFVSFSNGKIVVDRKNSGMINFTPGNVIFVI